MSVPDQQMIDTARQLANGRTILQHGGYSNGAWTKAYITIVKDGRPEVGNYEAIIVTNHGSIRQTWGNSQRTLWARVRRETLALLAGSR